MVEKTPHWADLTAEEIIKIKGKKNVVATGITPSGPIHLGNLREILTGDAIARALKEQGSEVRFIYIADSFDPLRKVYPFLPESYIEHVGKPISEIPDPEGCHENYAEHFLNPFLDAIKELGIEVEVIKIHEEYEKGTYTSIIDITLEKNERITEILNEIAGRNLEKDFVPLLPKCEKCGKLTTTKIISFDIKKHQVEYLCKCGHQGFADYSKGEAKLPWRLDWPGRWKIFGVTVEPFGKDHATAGGSYDTGKVIVEEIFNYPAPYPFIYEWIYLKGKGAMSSSKGIAISINDILKILPPSWVRYLILRYKPDKHIDFDPVNGYILLAEDYERLEKIYFGLEGTPEERKELARVFEISQVKDIPKEPGPQVPLRHIITLAQISLGNEELLKEMLIRSGYEKELNKFSEILKRVDYVRNWLENYAPSHVKFKLQEDLPQITKTFLPKEKDFLKALAEKIRDKNWEGEELQNFIYQLSQEFNIPGKRAFQLIYLSFLNQDSGPRAGYFLVSLPKDFVIRRLEEAGN
ncbi:MAG: lysine--tRNA ligase [Dictyoglomus sp.]|nr:lysine--tRNA ligase [Dictyoglomus sp.]MDW8189229.1 lysine--tRNA ligase [Dictyoglomus sp.]